MELNEAIKDQIAKNGIEIIKTKQFVNVLDDLGAFKNEPSATKRVLKHLLDSGFADLVYANYNNDNISVQNTIRKWISSYISRSGFKEELVNELADIFLSVFEIEGLLPKYKEGESEKKDRNMIKNDSPHSLMGNSQPQIEKTTRDILQHEKNQSIHIKRKTKCRNNTILDSLKNDYTECLNGLDRNMKLVEFHFCWSNFKLITIHPYHTELSKIEEKMRSHSDFFDIMEWCEIECNKINEIRRLRAKKRKKWYILLDCIQFLIPLLIFLYGYYVILFQ